MMGDCKALAALNDTEDDADCLLLDWSSLTDSVPLLQADALPPYTLGTSVRRGEWPKQEKAAGEPSTPTRDKNIPSNSPTSDGEVIPPSPVISSMPRRGRRKHRQGMSVKKISISPLVSQTDSGSQGSLLGSADLVDTPARRIADSLGCDQQGSDWFSTMETPTNTIRETMVTVERKALLPPEYSGIITTADQINTSPEFSLPVNISTPVREGMVGRQETRDTARTLFIEVSKVEGLSQVVTVRMEDLQEVDSGSEEEEDRYHAEESSILEKKKDLRLHSEEDTPSVAGEQLDYVPEDESKVAQETDDIPSDVKGAHLSSSPPNPPMLLVGGRKMEVSEEAETEKGQVDTKALSGPRMDTFTGGFTTAGGSRIEISENALAAARSRMGEAVKKNADDGRDISDRAELTSPSHAGGFSTAGGKNIKVSDRALAQARLKMNNTEAVKVVAPSHEKFVGFHSASGAKIEVSDKALKHARDKMKGMVTGQDRSNQPGVHTPAGLAVLGGAPAGTLTVGFSTARGTKITVSNKALEESRRNMSKVIGDDVAMTMNTTKHVDTPTGGFTTAGGAKIAVSEKALQAAKAKLEGLADENIPKLSNTKPATNMMKGFSTAGGANIEVSEEAMREARSTMKGLARDTKPAPVLNSLGQQKTRMGGGRGKGWMTGTGVRRINYPQQGTGRDTFAINGVSRGMEKGEFDQFETEWGDDEDLASIAETSERNFMALQEKPFTCQPYQVEMSETGYSGGLDMLQQKNEEDEGQGGFAAPYSAGSRKRVAEECELGRAMLGMGKRQRGMVGWEEEGNKFISVLDGRERSRKKQEELIKSKMKKKIRAIPGKLWKLRSQGERIPLVKVDIRMEAVMTRESMKSMTAGKMRFVGCEYFSSEAAEMNTTGLALGDGVMVMLSDEGDLGVEELTTAFLCCPGVDPKLVPDGWVTNHYRWIVWGLDSLERRLGRQILTPTSVMDRLKYRYDREVDRGERSILRKVLEKDESAAVPMVLCVSEVSSTHLVLTDCWYSLRSTIELGSALHKLVQKGKVVVGMKLIMQGAEIVGPQADAACSPLENEGREIRIHLNSTRRVRWAVKLGMTRPFMVSLSSLLVGGGNTAMLKVVIARVYPLMYFVKENERSKFISEKEWEKIQKKNGKDKSMEEVFSQVQKEVMDEERKKTKIKRKKVGEKELLSIECGEELLEILSSCEDSVLLGMLTRQQVKAMEEARMEKHEEIREKITEEVNLRVGGNKFSEGTPVLKVRVVDSQDKRGEFSGLVTIWRPGLVWMEMKEGMTMGLTGAQVNRVDGHTVHLTMGRQAQCEEIQRLCEEPPSFSRSISVLSRVCQPGYRPVFNELDLVLTVLNVELPRTGGFQTVTMTDESKHSVKLLVWGGVAAAGVHDLLQPGHVVSCKNIEWRSSSVSSWPVPSIYLSEHSVLSLHPKDKEHSLAVQQLQHMVKTTQFLVQARENLSRQMNRRQSRYPTPPTTPAHVSSPAQSRHHNPPTTPSMSTPPTISAWTSANLSTSTNSRMAKLDAYTTNLTRQGFQLPPPVVLLPPPPSKVMTPYKPPQSSQVGRKEKMEITSTQEMEEYAMEMMDQLDM